LFIKLLHDFKENNIPKGKLSAVNSCPWYSAKIKKLIKSRDNLFKRYSKTGLYHYRIRYKKLRNRITNIIRKAKSKYEGKIIKRARNNRKVFYSYIASKNRKKGLRKVGPVVKPNATGNGVDTVVDNREMANIFNDFFRSVFNKKLIKGQPKILDSNVYEGNNEPTIVFTQSMILEVFRDLKMNKSPGVDDISSTYMLSKLKTLL